MHHIPKHPLPRTLLFLITPPEQHLGMEERVSLSPLHTAAATDTERSSDTIASAPPHTSHTLDGVLFSSWGFLALIFKKGNVLYNMLVQNQILV